MLYSSIDFVDTSCKWRSCQTKNMSSRAKPNLQTILQRESTTLFNIHIKLDTWVPVLCTLLRYLEFFSPLRKISRSMTFKKCYYSWSQSRIQVLLCNTDFLTVHPCLSTNVCKSWWKLKSYWLFYIQYRTLYLTIGHLHTVQYSHF